MAGILASSPQGGIRASMVVAAAVAEYRANAAAAATTSHHLTEEQARFVWERAHATKNNVSVIAALQLVHRVTICSSRVTAIRKQETFVYCNSGRKSTLTAEEEALLLRATRLIRDASVPLDATLVSCMAVGIVEFHRRGSTALRGGSLNLSSSWAQKWLKGNGIAVRRATTDRTVTPNGGRRCRRFFLRRARCNRRRQSHTAEEKRVQHGRVFS